MSVTVTRLNPKTHMVESIPLEEWEKEQEMSHFVKDRRVWTHDGVKRVHVPGPVEIILLAVVIIGLAWLLIVPLLAAIDPLIK